MTSHDWMTKRPWLNAVAINCFVGFICLGIGSGWKNTQAISDAWSWAGQSVSIAHQDKAKAIARLTHAERVVIPRLQAEVGTGTSTKHDHLIVAAPDCTPHPTPKPL